MRSVAIILMSVLTSCSLGPERWEPHVLSADYEQDAQVFGIDLSRTSPVIVVDAGEHLEFLNFTLRVLPTKRSSDGVVISKIADVPPVPSSALNLTVRVSATPRKWNKSGPCYDRKDQLVTEWLPVEGGQWVVRPQWHPWVIREDWDEIRIGVHVRGLPGADPEPDYMVNSIMLQPRRTNERLKRNVGQNIFMRVWESFRGEKDCGG